MFAPDKSQTSSRKCMAFQHTGALARQNTITHERNTTTHARTHGLVATRSVWRGIHSTCTNLRPQRTQTQLRIHHIAQCHEREAHIKSGAPAREYKHYIHVCVHLVSVHAHDWFQKKPRAARPRSSISAPSPATVRTTTAT